MNTEPDSLLNAKLLQVICQLHDWENQHLHLVQSQAGRYLYLSLVKQLIQANQDQPSALLKGNRGRQGQKRVGHGQEILLIYTVYTSCLFQ
jgi:hypothetical protein